MKRARRGKDEYKHLYKTAAWERLRSTLLNDDPWCRFCATKGLKVPADVADHKIPHRGNLELFHDYDNLTPLCFSCHNSTKQKIEKGVVVIEYDERGMPIKAKSS